MVSILFWNVAKREGILPHLKCFADHYSLDVILLAESPDDLGPTLDELNALKRGIYFEPAVVRPKVRALTRLHDPNFKHIFTSISGETAIWSVRSSILDPPELLLAVTHLPSKAGGNTPSGQAGYVALVASELAGIEDDRKNYNTVLVGDFNMNPYEDGMILVTALHAQMTSNLARKPDRLHGNRRYRRFYNPMWGFFGDQTKGPPGTHYWKSSQPGNTYWSILDQVLLRPSLIDRLSSLDILPNDGTHSLMGHQGHPHKEHFSDHLPILFGLDI